MKNIGDLYMGILVVFGSDFWKLFGLFLLLLGFGNYWWFLGGNCWIFGGLADSGLGLGKFGVGGYLGVGCMGVICGI